jgi:RNA recognition motif-containing protein
VATLVVKNLALDLEKDSILRYLKDRNVEPTEVELHTDALGAFRGTAFVRYGHPDDARAALDKLGACVELGGRRARIEIQKSKSLIGRRSLEAELPHEELGIVRAQIEGFLWDPSLTEMRLPPAFNVQQRKYAHSLAERHSLSHLTQQGETGEKFVLLSKARRFQQQDSTPTLRTRTKAYSMNADESTMAMAGCRKKKVRSSSGSFMLHYSDYSPASAPTPNMYSPNLDAIPDDMLLPGPCLPLLPPGLELSGGHMAPPPGLSWTPYDNDTAWLDDFKLVEQGTSIFELAMAEADEENTADNADKFSEKSTACSNEDESSPQKRTVSDMSPQSNEDLKVCARPTDDACGRADLVEALQLALREKVPCGGP